MSLFRKNNKSLLAFLVLMISLNTVIFPRLLFGLAPSTHIDEARREMHRRSYATQAAHLLLDTRADRIALMILKKLDGDPSDVAGFLDALWAVRDRRDKLEESLGLVTVHVKGTDKDLWNKILRAFPLGNLDSATIALEMRMHLWLTKDADSETSLEAIPTLPAPYRPASIVLRGRFEFHFTHDAVRHFLEAFGPETLNTRNAPFRPIGRGYAMTPWPIPASGHAQIFHLPRKEGDIIWILSYRRIPVAIASGTGINNVVFLSDLGQGEPTELLQGKMLENLHKLATPPTKGTVIPTDASWLLADFRKVVDPGEYPSAIYPAIQWAPAATELGKVPLFAGVYPPSTLDSAALLNEVLPDIQPGEEVLVLCCGSGVDAVAIALKHPNVTVLAADIKPLAVANTKALAQLKGVTDRVQTIVSDGFLDIPPGKKFDRIVANLPAYVTLESLVRLGDINTQDLDGKLLLTVLMSCQERLKPGGKLDMMAIPANWVGYHMHRLGLKVPQPIHYGTHPNIRSIWRLKRTVDQKPEPLREWFDEILRLVWEMASDLHARWKNWLYRDAGPVATSL